MILSFSYYYAFVIGRDLSHADILITDMTRMTTAPMSDTSFKANMTNLITSRLDDKSDSNKERIYDNLDRSIMVDPVNYIRSREGMARLGLRTDEEAERHAQIFRHGRFTGLSSGNMFNDRPGQVMNPAFGLGLRN